MDKQKGRGRFAFLCVAPATILFIIFMVIPTLQVFWYSLFKWGGYSDEGKTFVGLQNFETLLTDAEQRKSMESAIGAFAGPDANRRIWEQILELTAGRKPQEI